VKPELAPALKPERKPNPEPELGPEPEPEPEPEPDAIEQIDEESVLYFCDHGCGYNGTYDDVEGHEATCVFQGVGAEGTLDPQPELKTEPEEPEKGPKPEEPQDPQDPQEPEQMLELEPESPPVTIELIDESLLLVSEPEPEVSKPAPESQPITIELIDESMPLDEIASALEESCVDARANSDVQKCCIEDAQKQLDRGAQEASARRYDAAVACFEAGMRCLEAVEGDHDSRVQKILADLQIGLVDASREIEAAKVQAEAKRLQQAKALKTKQLRRTGQSETAPDDTTPAAHATVKKQHVGNEDAPSSPARHIKLKEWLPEQRKVAATHVNDGRKSATAGKYDEAARHYDKAKRMLGGHSTRIGYSVHTSTPDEAAQPRSLREQWQECSQPEAKSKSASNQEAKGNSRSNKAAKKKSKALGALGKPTKKHKKKHKKRRKMKPIMEEPRRPGCVGWLLGASMTEEDSGSDDDNNQSLGSDFCVLGSGLAIAIAGVSLIAKTRAIA